MLTVAQAEVIYLLSMDGRADGSPFTPSEAFPERNNQHNGARRVLRTLAKKGILETTEQPDWKGDPSKLVTKFVCGQRALETFDEWARKRDYDFSCFGH